MQSRLLVGRPERLLRARDVYAKLGVSRSTFYDLLRKGEFPAAVRISLKRVGWSEAAVDGWIQSRPQVSLPRQGVGHDRCAP
jgi:prophage regulatory protein